ncbi:hypothetical protein ACT91Q_17780 [Brevibacillus thermoruber]|jgi:hypothetical protein|uniref:hypothetical protein n=1 Tax=Brevibacillus thermoruber TaxID=33942 RepID=UPI00404258F2
MGQLRIVRELRLKNLEFFLITDGYAGPKICHMLFLDYRRPSTLEDFPFLIGIEDEDTFGRANFMKVIIISDADLDEHLKEELEIIASGFLENKPECHWVMEYEIASIDPKHVGLGENILPSIKPILSKHNFFLEYDDIPQQYFNYLSQDIH